MNSLHLPEPVSMFLMRVHGLAEIEYLVKESEVRTGQPGRIFVISGADKLTYRVRWHPVIVEIERLDSAGAVVDSQHLSTHDVATHSLVDALMAGQLYTAPVPTVLASVGCHDQ